MLMYIKIPQGMTYKLVNNTDCLVSEEKTVEGIEPTESTEPVENKEPAQEKILVNVQQIAKEAIRTFNKSKMNEPMKLKDAETKIEVTVYFVKHTIRHSSDTFLLYTPADNGKMPGKVEVKEADKLVSKYRNSTAVWFTEEALSEKNMERVMEKRAEQKRDRYEKGPKSV